MRIYANPGAKRFQLASFWVPNVARARDNTELLSAVVGVLSAGTEPPLNCAWAAVNASQGVAPAQVRGLMLVCKLRSGDRVWGEVRPPQARKFWRYLVSITAFWP